MDQQTDALTLITLEKNIKLQIAQLDRVKEEIKKENEMLNSLLDNDPTYKEHEGLAKIAVKQKSGTKHKILNQPSGKPIVEKIKSLKEQQKELQEGQSYYLTQYQQLSGSNQFEDESGDLREIVYIAKLVKRGGK